MEPSSNWNSSASLPAGVESVYLPHISLTSPQTRNPTVIVPARGPPPTDRLRSLGMVLRATLFVWFVPGSFEQFNDLLVRGLLEVPVPEAYGPQVRRRLQADQIVHHAQKEIGGLGCAYGRCQDQSSRLPQTQGLYCGAGRHPGSEAVVDQDRGPPHHFCLGPLAPEVAQSAPYLRELLLRDLLDVVVGDAETPDHVLVEDTHTAGRDGPDAELWLPWRPELARDEHVERRSERARDLIPYRHPSSWQGEDYGPLVLEAGQLPRKPAARVPAILERRKAEDPHSLSASSARTAPGPRGHSECASTRPHTPTRELSPRPPAWWRRRSRSGRRGCSHPRGRTQGARPRSRGRGLRSGRRSVRKSHSPAPCPLEDRLRGRRNPRISGSAGVRIPAARAGKPRRKQPHRGLPPSQQAAASSP